MADDGATRTRRWKLHRAGDHSECRRACEALSVPLSLPAADGTGIDPGRSLRALAERLEGAHVADPGNAMVARELRQTLTVLASASRGRPKEDDIDKMRREWMEGSGGV